jgi:hypothetical protein
MLVLRPKASSPSTQRHHGKERTPAGPPTHHAEWLATGVLSRDHRGMSVRGVSREAAIADYGVVLTGRLDDDLVSYDVAATDAARATRSALAEVLFARGPGQARLCGGVSYADVDVVGS